MVVISEGIFWKHSKRQCLPTCPHFLLGLVGVISLKVIQDCSSKFNFNDATIVGVRRSTLKDTPQKPQRPIFPRLTTWPHTNKRGRPSVSASLLKLTSMQWAATLRIGPWRKELDPLPTWRWDLRGGDTCDQLKKGKKYPVVWNSLINSWGEDSSE